MIRGLAGVTRLPLVGVGGIFDGADAYEKIRAGASLVQVYSGFIYRGPGTPRRIARELSALLAKDGFGNVREAIGADHSRLK
jgi:dihydroorotate dehydrogenase